MVYRFPRVQIFQRALAAAFINLAICTSAFATNSCSPAEFGQSVAGHDFWDTFLEIKHKIGFLPAYWQEASLITAEAHLGLQFGEQYESIIADALKDFSRLGHPTYLLFFGG